MTVRGSWFMSTLVCLLSYAQATYGASSSVENELSFARGINLASAEFNPERSPAIYGKDYIYPSAKDLKYYARKGFSVVRLPYRWERLQPSLLGNLDQAELGRIKSVVASAQALNMRVILSPHNYGRYFVAGNEVLIGTPGVSIAAFADFSRKVAMAFAGNAGIYALSLMNEPHDTQGLWKQTAQAGLTAIRTADRQRLVLVPGDGWSGAWSWRQNNDDLLLDDPADRIMYEAHQYFDLDHSGTYRTDYVLSNASPDRGVELVRPFAEWLKLRRTRGIITEFGVPGDDPRWRELTQRLLAYLAQQNVPWTYWAGGPWWGTYPLSAEPKNGVDAPIMSVLTKDYGVLSKSH